MEENSIEEDIKILEEKMSKELDFLIKNANKAEQLTAISIIAMKEPIILLFLSILSDYKRVLKINEVLLKENEILKEEKEQAWEEWNNLEQGSYETEQKIKQQIKELQKENESLKAKLEYKQYGDLDNAEFEKYINDIVETKTKELKEQLEEEQELNKIIKETRINKILENNIEVKKLREENEELHKEINRIKNLDIYKLVEDWETGQLIPIQKIKDIFNVKIHNFNYLSKTDCSEIQKYKDKEIADILERILQELLEGE